MLDEDALLNNRAHPQARDRKNLLRARYDGCSKDGRLHDISEGVAGRALPIRTRVYWVVCTAAKHH